MTLSIGIINILKQRGLNLREIAEIAKVHPSELSRINAGSREWTTPQLLLIAGYLQQPLGATLLCAMRQIEDRSAWSDCMSKLVDAVVAEFERGEGLYRSITYAKPKPPRVGQAA